MFGIRSHAVLCAVALGLVVAAGASAEPLTRITLDFEQGPNLQAMMAGTPAEQALAANVMNGFYAAGDLWANRLADAITVNIKVDYKPLEPNVLGSTDSYTADNITYNDVRLGLSYDATTPDDQTAVAHLQAGPYLDFITNDTSVSPPATSPIIRDSDSSANNRVMDINRANAKALGLIQARHPASDGEVIFSSDYTWDFDASDGISSGAFDFVGVAAHELGHVLGFVSGVDVVDLTAAPNGPQAPLDLQNHRVFGPRDLFRYSPTSLAEPNQPADGAVLDLAVGTDAYFSLDAGATALAPVATGRYNGDGHQASHWAAGRDLGLMDPTTMMGIVGRLSALDLAAMDAIGYDRLAFTWGDLNDDGTVDAVDIDALTAAIAAGMTDLTFDLDYDNLVGDGDLDAMILTHLATRYGDSDLDGDVDLDDFVALKTHFGSTGLGWAAGDFDGDTDIDLDDFAALKLNFGTAAVPEPGTAALLALAGLSLPRRHKHS
ncbi:MAG: NF038122 family metalloprotease [Planctomycetota bacterium]